MAIRLGPYVVYGELRNTGHYYTSGAIALRGETPGEDTVVHLQLTGNCADELRGKRIRFMPPEDDPDQQIFRKEEFPGFQFRQIGPTGTMTVNGWVRTLTCSVEEHLRRSRLGEPPPTHWKRRLSFEWFGQNGRIVIELAGALVEVCTREGTNGERDEWAVIPNTAPLPDLSAMKGTPVPDISLISLDEGKVHMHRFSPEEVIEAAEHAECAADPLQRALDAENAAIERALQGESESDDEFIHELELMDRSIEDGDEEPILSLLGDIGELPPPEQLSDDAVESRLKMVLGRFALLGLTLDVCDHFTIRDCYKLLRDKILPEETAHPKLAGTGWVQHMSTQDWCDQCQEEFVRDYDDDSDSPPF